MYSVGIDFGTTNTALAYSSEEEAGVHVFTFFLSALNNPIIESAKSWLHYGDEKVLLPLEGEGAKLTPLLASTRVFKTLKEKWDKEHAPLHEQKIVVTCPASFNEKARRHILNAAKNASLPQITLLEEPLAAFYTLLHETKPKFAEGAKIVVIDIGGGTTDFTLIEAGKMGYSRLYSGPHILLGGDNLDLAISHSTECSLEEAKKKRLRREDSVKEILAPFFRTDPYDLDPFAGEKPGIRKIGLPYAQEPSFIAHFARFLKSFQINPDVILLNGGIFKDKTNGLHFIEAVKLWFSKTIPVYHTPCLDTSCAKGAVYYAESLKGKIPRVFAGTSKTYYLELPESKLLTLVSRGTEEGKKVVLDSNLNILTSSPTLFRLWSSSTRLDDQPGSILDFDPEIEPEAHASTQLSYGKTAVSLPVAIQSEWTATGILSVLLQSKNTPHEWELSFSSNQGLKSALYFDKGLIDSASQLIREAFLSTGKEKLNSLMKDLEKLTEKNRLDFPVPFLRALWTSLYQVASRREASPYFREKWWQLAGFILRPGTGFPLDEERMKEFWRTTLSEKKRDDILMIALRRVQGGLSEGQQNQVLPSPEKELSIEELRLIGSLEKLDPSTKKKAGEMLFANLNPLKIWTLAKLGSRKPQFGSIHHILPGKVIDQWLKQLNYKDLDITYLLTEWLRYTGEKHLTPSKASVKQFLETINDPLLIDLVNKVMYQEGDIHTNPLEVTLEPLPLGLVLQI